MGGNRRIHESDLRAKATGLTSQPVTSFNENLWSIPVVKPAEHTLSPIAGQSAGRLITWLLTVVWLWPAAAGVIGAETAGTVAESPTITDPGQIWNLSTEQRTHPHPLRIEGRVSYFDPGFRMFWMESNGVGTYVQLDAAPPPFRTGQRVVIEGKITPNKGLSAEDVTVRVLEEKAPVTPLETKSRINDFNAFHGRMVTAEGYVDSQQFIDAQHVRLMLIVENRPVICWINPDDPARVPNWQGRFVRATGLYSRRFDPTQTSASIELWLGRQDGLQVVDTLENSAWFHRPPTAINELYRTPAGTEVVVRGRLEKHQVGSALIVRDATGQVEIRSIQQQRFPANTEIEAVGRVDFDRGQWVIESALYRPVRQPVGEPVVVPDGVLRSVGQIRALGPEEAAQGRPVDISGMVTWSLPESDFLFLQDLTGGIRVYFEQTKTGVVQVGKYFRIKGVTRAGRMAPAVELRDSTDLGSMSHPPAKPITLEQALTGKEDGEWVEMLGFMQGTVSEGDRRWIHVTTPAGEFTGHLQNPVNFVANPGSLIRLHGVCETTLDADGHVKGITLRVPYLHDITIEKDAPADFYALSRTPLGDLEQISTAQGLLRVRVTGTVQHAVPGRQIYLRDEDANVLLLTHNSQRLQPGDQIEAVGILGREGARTILRETEIRKTGTVPAPEPFVIENVKQLVPAADSRLVRLRGTLIHRVVFDHQGQTRLTLQQGNTLFEATLDQTAGAPLLDKPIGAGLEVTGIYQLKFDDARQARGFQLLLRTPDDAVIFRQPQLWTLQRALTVAAVLGGCVLLGVAWITSLRRRVQQQTTQLRMQMEHQARLEAEVQRAARLESLGSLAGGIAHDYNNLLTVILGNLSLMKFNPEVMTNEGGRIDDIERAALRARDLTRQLLTFAEGGDPLRAVVDLSGLVRETAETCLRGTGLNFAYEAGADLLPVYVDRDQIIQVVQHLVRNAAEAMPNGGNLRLLLANAEIRSGFHPSLKPGRYVRMAFIDTGEGISPDALPRIFDPYFSTKNTGGGLGLATVYSIVKKHQGHIEAQSKPGQGAAFTLWLPVADAAVHAQTELPLIPPPPVVAAPSPGSGVVRPLRVLLMDDEESIRKLGSIILQRMGLDACAVADGASAVSEFENARKAGRPFDLLILDLTIMGGKGGKDTIAVIRKTDATVPAIVSSGYSRDPVMAQFGSYGFQAVIPKPYDIKLFKETVQRFLPKQARSG